MAKEPPKRPEIKSTRDNTAGRVETDSRGNTVWRWAPGNSLDSTTHLLKRLDNDALALEPTRRLARLKSADPAKQPAERKASGKKGRFDEPVRDQGGGFNPYNRSR
jgi:hypothetical protein